MQSTVLRSTVAGIGLAALLGFAPAAFAEIQNYTATLSPQSEVPRLPGPPPTARWERPTIPRPASSPTASPTTS